MNLVMQTKNQKNENSMRESAKKMMSFLGAVAMLGTSFPAATVAQSADETTSDAYIECASKNQEMTLRSSVENDSSNESYEPSDSCQWGCSGSCWSSCQSSCRGTCASGCTGSCMGGCKGACMNGCNAGSGYRW